MIQLNNFSQATREQREPVIKKVIEQNSGRFPQIADQLKYMEAFGISKALNRRTDVFSDTGAENYAVGYRVKHTGTSFVAEPWVWRVTDVRKMQGIEIGERPKSAIYLGVVVPKELLARHGNVAFSLLLGNLPLLSKCRSKLVSY